MNRMLGIELRRSAAAGAALVLLLAGATMLYAVPKRWSVGSMPLAMSQREYLVLLWPLALAAGAWQARRQQRSHVAELFASTACPQAQRMVPTKAGHFVHRLGILAQMMYAAGANEAGCSVHDGDDAVDLAALAWLLSRAPAYEFADSTEHVDGPPSSKAVALWQALRDLAEKEAAARVAAVRRAATACEATAGLLSRSAR